MEKCANCSGDCLHCGGCGASYVLTQAELDLLLELGQYAFLPVGRRADDLTPILCSGGDCAQNSLVLQCLEKKNLIELDFYTPLKGFDGYGNLPLRGSCALTLQGQQVLDALQIHGAL